MRIVVGCPLKDRSWALPRWLQAIANQGVELELVCLLSPSEDNTEEVLKQHPITLLYDERPGRSVLEIDTHAWGNLNGKYEYMASLRNQLIDYVIERDADFFFSLDSDIILPQNA